MDLVAKRCRPCEGGVPPLTAAAAKRLQAQTPHWSLGDKAIERTFEFDDFVQAMDFVGVVARIAESEGHHPDIHVEKYRFVRLVLSTHAIGGLSENDFIVAAKVDAGVP